MVNHEVKDLKLVEGGKRRIEWADGDMPVLRKIRERFAKEKPLQGKRMSACLHVTAETANLMRTLQAGGAELVLVASNPLSTQDDVAAALVAEYGISTYAIKGEDNQTYYNHIHTAIKHNPQITMDDGADLVSTLHSDYPAKCQQVICSMEETTTGVIRLRAMAKDQALHIPVIAVNDAETKYLFDNRYGTGQSTVDGIIRATDFLVAGKKIVIAGYGWCGKGFAMRMRGMGGNIIVTEVNPIRALEAAMDGFSVMPMSEAARIGDLFCTLTGDIHVLRREHFALMKDGAIVANSGHFNVEINIEELEAMAVRKNRGVRNFVDEYVMKDGRRIYLLAEGRLINLAAAEGHPASVMDMSFATQALTTEYAVKNKLEIGVYDVPQEIEQWIAITKLETMGVQIDQLTPEQQAYLASWNMGT
jgi:adenosylhomocysteinase